MADMAGAPGGGSLALNGAVSPIIAAALAAREPVSFMHASPPGRREPARSCAGRRWQRLDDEGMDIGLQHIVQRLVHEAMAGEGSHAAE